MDSPHRMTHSARLEDEIRFVLKEAVRLSCIVDTLSSIILGTTTSDSAPVCETPAIIPYLLRMSSQVRGAGESLSSTYARLSDVVEEFMGGPEDAPVGCE